MIIDKFLQLWDSVALTSSADSTNTVDLGAASLDVGKGEPMCVVLNVEVAADSTTGDETYEFNFVQSANADLSTDDELCSIAFTAAQAAAGLLAAGKVYVIPIPVNRLTKQYIGAAYVGGGTSPTITVSAHIQPLSMVQAEGIFPDNITIS